MDCLIDDGEFIAFLMVCSCAVFAQHWRLGEGCGHLTQRNPQKTLWTVDSSFNFLAHSQFLKSGSA